MKNDAATAFLLIYAGLFPIVNPIGGAPIFLGLTRHCSEKRNSLAFRVMCNSFLLLLSSLLFGSYVLEFFGITLPILRVAGGLVVTATGWNLLQAGDVAMEESTAPRPPISNEAFYPLTMPITVGPGSIAVAITLGSQRPKTGNLSQLALISGSAVAGLIAIAATIYVCYRFAERLVGALGESGTDVLVRLSAFILLCIGIEIVWNGYSSLVHAVG